jgi:hypothetical protein
MIHLHTYLDALISLVLLCLSQPNLRMTCFTILRDPLQHNRGHISSSTHRRGATIPSHSQFPFKQTTGNVTHFNKYQRAAAMVITTLLTRYAIEVPYLLTTLPFSFSVSTTQVTTTSPRLSSLTSVAAEPCTSTMLVEPALAIGPISTAYRSTFTVTASVNCRGCEVLSTVGRHVLAVCSLLSLALLVVQGGPGAADLKSWGREAGVLYYDCVRE